MTSDEEFAATRVYIFTTNVIQHSLSFLCSDHVSDVSKGARNVWMGQLRDASAFVNKNGEQAWSPRNVT